MRKYNRDNDKELNRDYTSLTKNFWYDEYDDYYTYDSDRYDYYDEYRDVQYQYKHEYVEDKLTHRLLRNMWSKSGGRLGRRTTGLREIDMDSIYDKQKRREIKIDRILDNIPSYKNLLGDFLK